MNLEERLKKVAPDASKANIKGGDKTLLEANGGDIGQGGAGHSPSKPYSDKFK